MVENLSFPGAPVKSIAEFIEVTLQVFFPNAMKGSQQGGFGVRDQDMHPS